MEVCRKSSWLLLLLGVSLLATTLQGVQGEAESEGPSESECRPYIEKALKELESGDNVGAIKNPDTDDSKEDVPTIEITTDDSDDHQNNEDGDDETREESAEQNVEEKTSNEQVNAEEINDTENENAELIEGAENQEETIASKEESAENVNDPSQETTTKSEENNSNEDMETNEKQSQEDDDKESENDAEETQDNNNEQASEEIKEQSNEAEESQETADNNTNENTTAEQEDSNEELENDIIAPIETSAETIEETQVESEEANLESSKETDQAQSIEQTSELKESVEEENTQENSIENVEKVSVEVNDESLPITDDDNKSNEETEQSQENEKSIESPDDKSDESNDNKSDAEEKSNDKTEKEDSSTELETPEEVDQRSTEQDSRLADEVASSESTENESRSPADQAASGENKSENEEEEEEIKDNTVVEEDDDDISAPEEELSLDIDIPTDLRNTDHVEHLLKLDAEASETETIINRVADITLRELKKLYENAIKPLEVLYKYRDLSNRHFGDAEIFSKPLILFMGPWSGGKSSIINYLLNNEYNETSLKTGAEPSPAYFNLLLHGDEYEVIDGTQLAADFTFSGLQKFGQGLEERLRGVKLPHKLLERVNIVEIPGILEVRKQVSRVFPFNDACQWFIDRADIIFLVYDPSKLDVGPETEAILDQLKGREHQSRIILNKADQVKPEELMRVQGALIWNISPLMSSPQPPIMYTTSLWSKPYESWAPTRLLQAQERAFLRDLRSAVDKRIENKIASARRFAVRVRNHAKMVDCYLTTYYNHKSVFGNRKQVADEIIEHPQDYHIYEGLSTLTNISRYDLPDPEVYRDFFKLNPLYEFQQLSATCTYFRGCPINRLDIAIAYDLPELFGKHKRLIESALAEANQTPVPGS